MHKYLLSLTDEAALKLAALAEESERLDSFDAFILDSQMSKTPFYISVYLQVIKNEFFSNEDLFKNKEKIY